MADVDAGIDAHVATVSTERGTRTLPAVYRRRHTTKGRTDMRIYLAAAVLVALALPVLAAAKGPAGASISGPGLDRALSVRGDGEGPGTALGTLAMASGFFPQMFGQTPDPTLRSRPGTSLGLALQSRLRRARAERRGEPRRPARVPVREAWSRSRTCDPGRSSGTARRRTVAGSARRPASRGCSCVPECPRSRHPERVRRYLATAVLVGLAALCVISAASPSSSA